MILLTSSIATVAKHLHANYLSGKGYQTVLFIDTAAEMEIGKVEGDDDWLQADLRSLQDQGYQVDRFSVTGKTKDEIETEIDKYDILYMCGGNTLYLLKQLQNTGAFDLIIKKVNAGKPYIGTSAGSVIAGPKVPVYLEEEVDFQLDSYAGFKFTNLLIVPHWGSEYFKDMYLGEPIRQAYRDDEPPFLLISDYHYVSVAENGALEVINTRK